MLNKTIAKIGYAMNKAMTAESCTYDEKITWLESTESGGRNVSMEPQSEAKKIYSDGIAAVNVDVNNGYTGSVELLSICDDVEADWFGYNKEENGNIAEYGGIIEPRPMAFIVAKETFNGDKKYQVDIYYNVTAKRPNRADKTSEGASFDPNFPTYNLEALPRLHDKLTRYTIYVDELPESITEPQTNAIPSV